MLLLSVYPLRVESASLADSNSPRSQSTQFGFFNIIETFADLILYWFPFCMSTYPFFYFFFLTPIIIDHLPNLPFSGALDYTFKCVFIVWLMLPQTRGAQTVYHKALKPLVASAASKTSAPPETAPQ